MTDIEGSSLVAKLFAARWLLDQLPDYVAVLERDCEIVFVNRSLPERPAEEIIGTNALDHLPTDQRAIFRDAFARVWRKGNPEVVEFHTNSGRAWEARLVPIQEPHGTALMLVVSREVTQRRQTEQALQESEGRLRLAVAASGMGLWTWYSDGDRVGWDARLCEILGISRDEAPRDFASYLAIVHPQDRGRVQEALARYLQQGVYEDLEHRVVRPSGEVRVLLCSGTPIPDASGRTIGFRGGAFDITERKRVSEQLTQSQKMEAVGQLTAGVAHNFNNLLTVILSNVELSREDAEGEQLARLQDIELAAKRAAEMVKQLMLFARPSAPNRKSAVDLTAIVRQTLEMCRTTFDRKIRFELSAEPALPKLSANSIELEQAMLNIFLNARDAFEEARTIEPMIWVRVERASAESLAVSIRDNAHGMDAATQSRVFEPFFTTKEVGRGTGLGLSSAYAICQDHGGRITCESEVGVGTTFRIELPISAAAKSEPPPRSLTPPATGSETVLLVDDEALVRRGVRGLLERAGYRVLEASDGHEALRLFSVAAREIALVLLDRSMPELSGEEVLERIRAVSAEIPVLLLTGHLEPAVTPPRATAVLSKPVARSALLSAVRRAIDGARATAR